MLWGISRAGARLGEELLLGEMWDFLLLDFGGEKRDLEASRGSLLPCPTS